MFSAGFSGHYFKLQQFWEIWESCFLMDTNQCSSTNFHWHHWPLGIEGSRQHHDFCEMVGKTSTKKPWESGLSFHVHTLGALVTVSLSSEICLSCSQHLFLSLTSLKMLVFLLSFLALQLGTFPFSASPGLVFFPRRSDGTDAGKFTTTPEVNDQTLVVFYFRKEMPRAGRRCQTGSSEKHRLFLHWAGWAQTPSPALWCQRGPDTAARDSHLPLSSCRWSITHPHTSPSLCPAQQPHLGQERNPSCQKPWLCNPGRGKGQKGEQLSERNDGAGDGKWSVLPFYSRCKVRIRHTSRNEGELI